MRDRELFCGTEMEISLSALILPIGSFGTLGWPMSSPPSSLFSSSRMRSSSWETSLRFLSSCDAGTETALNDKNDNHDDNSALQEHLLCVLRCALQRNDPKVARDALHFLAALQVGKYHNNTTNGGDNTDHSGDNSHDDDDAGVKQFANLLLLHGIMAAVVEAAEAVVNRSGISSLQPLLPTSFDFVASNCSGLLLRVSTLPSFSNTVNLCRALALAELSLCRGGERSVLEAERLLLLAAESSSTISTSSISAVPETCSRVAIQRQELLNEWRLILLRLCRLMHGSESSSDWSQYMLERITCKQQQQQQRRQQPQSTADDVMLEGGYRLAAQMRLRASFLLFDHDFFVEHLFLATTPLAASRYSGRRKKAVARPPRSSRPSSRTQSDDEGPDTNDISVATTTTAATNNRSAEGICHALFPSSFSTPAAATKPTLIEEGEEEDASISARLNLRVARAKVIGFISSSSSVSCSNGATKVELLSAVDTCLNILNDAQRRTAPPALQQHFGVVIQEALETVCHLAMCAVLKIIFVAQSQLGVVKITSHPSSSSSSQNASSSQKPHRERASLIGFVKSFIELFCTHDDAQRAPAAPAVVTVSLSSLQAVAIHLRERIQQTASLRRNTAATKPFSDERLRSMERTALALMVTLGCDDDDQHDNLIPVPSSSTSLTPLLEISSSAEHSAIFKRRLALRQTLLQVMRIVPTGDIVDGVESTRVVLASTVEQHSNSALQRDDGGGALLSGNELLVRERKLFERLLGLP